MEAKFQAVPQDEGTAAIYADNTVESQNAPPSYNSIFDKLKNAKSDAKNPIQFVQSSSEIICGSAGASIVLVFSVLVPIACIVIGVMKRDDCPIQTYIPLWLIISGACGCFTAAVKATTNVGMMIRKRKGETTQGMFLNGLNCFNGLVAVFSFAWFITGNVWVYSIHNKVNYYDIHSLQYCDHLCYVFSFWVITVSWICIGLACCCCCFLVACGAGMMACLANFSK